MSAMDTRKVSALTTYGTSGPHAVYRSAPTTGPIIHASVSMVWSSEFAFVSSSSGTRFGSPAYAAGRKKPVATPEMAASATMSAGLSVNGSTANTPKRAMSEPIMSHRRESRSTSGPSSSPMTTIGRKSAIRSPATQHRRPREIGDVERERDGGDVRAEARSGRRQEKQPEGRRAAD